MRRAARARSPRALVGARLRRRARLHAARRARRTAATRAEPAATTTAVADGTGAALRRRASASPPTGGACSAARRSTRSSRRRSPRNPRLEAARATLRRSQDSLRAGYGVFFPQVDAQRGREPAALQPARPARPAERARSTCSRSRARVSYALDIWGGAAPPGRGARAQVDAQRYTLAGAYVDALGQRRRRGHRAGGLPRRDRRDAGDRIALEEEQVRIAEAQATAGTVPYANVLSLESQIASTEATLPPLEQKIDQADAPARDARRA